MRMCSWASAESNRVSAMMKAMKKRVGIIDLLTGYGRRRGAVYGEVGLVALSTDFFVGLVALSGGVFIGA